jgi:shikimate kinase
MSKKSIILIGMPGAGKSTIGPLLADRLGMPFEDTDVLVRQKDGRELKKIVMEDGFEKFLEIQQKIILSSGLKHTVIATGGSVIKSDGLMRHFQEIGTVVYLKVGFDLLEQRLAPDRKLARAGGQTFRQLFDERVPLYLKYAAYVVECSGRIPEDIMEEIAGFIGE